VTSYLGMAHLCHVERIPRKEGEATQKRETIRGRRVILSRGRGVTLAKSLGSLYAGNEPQASLAGGTIERNKTTYIGDSKGEMWTGKGRVNTAKVGPGVGQRHDAQSKRPDELRRLYSTKRIRGEKRGKGIAGHNSERAKGKPDQGRA